jgi:proton-dependent oligopeptide transporter, POT family
MSQNNEPQLFGHPKGLFYLFFAELWERFSFYGMRALLMVYMTEEIYRALAERDIIASTIYAAYGSLVYATPVLGGMLADKLFGFRRSILLGGSLMALGHFVLALENQIAFL